MFESLFNKELDGNFIKKSLQHRCFLVNITCLEEHLWAAASISCYFNTINLKQFGFCTTVKLNEIFIRNLRLNEISTHIFFQFYCKINGNQLKITYGLNSVYFKILNLKFWGRSQLTKRFEFHSDSRGSDEIKDLAISIDFKT